MFLSSLAMKAQEAPKSCCSEQKTEQAACAEKPSDAAKSCCADKAAAKPAGNCAEQGAAKKESCAHGEGQVGKQCCGACQEGANKPQVVTMHRIQGGQVHLGEAPMHRMHKMGESTEMTVDTIVSGDSTKVIVKVMKRANLGQGESLEDVMIHLDGVELPEGAFSGEPHVFMFRGEGEEVSGMTGAGMNWIEHHPMSSGNAVFVSADKGTLGVKLEKREDIQGALVVEVIPASTAAALGLKVGDIIVGVDAQKVVSEQGMMDAMVDKKTGDAILVTYRRDGKKAKVSGFLIPTAPMMGMPMGGLVRGLPGIGQGEVEIITGGTAQALGDNVQITEEMGDNGEKRVKVIVIKKDEN